MTAKRLSKLLDHIPTKLADNNELFVNDTAASISMETIKKLRVNHTLHLYAVELFVVEYSLDFKRLARFGRNHHCRNTGKYLCCILQFEAPITYRELY
eukprot:UN03079